MKTLLVALLCVLFASPLHADPKPWEEEGCDMQKVDLKLAPEALVREFVRRDMAGEFTSSNDWQPKAVVCPGHMGGPDSSTVVSDAKVAPTTASADVANFEVTYAVLGTVSSGGANGDQNTFEPKPESRKVAYVALRTPFGWKLQDPEWPMISPAAVDKVFGQRAWVPGDRAKFDRAAGRK